MPNSNGAPTETYILHHTTPVTVQGKQHLLPRIQPQPQCLVPLSMKESVQVGLCGFSMCWPEQKKWNEHLYFFFLMEQVEIYQISEN